MAGFLSGFGHLGLSELEEEDLFEEKAKEQIKKAPPKEEDFLLEKAVVCPICGQSTTQKIMKTGKAKLISTDLDLRPRYEYIDAQKYDVYQCDLCGYAALSKYYSHLTPKQSQMIQDHITPRVTLNFYGDTTYSYREALERYQLALANAVVKKAKAGEKAYICLKTAWLLRGYGEETRSGGDAALAEEIQRAEMEYTQKAFDGFSKAVTEDTYPICGMDETTMDYLMGALALKLNRTDIASRMVGKILQSTKVSTRIKDRTRLLKEEVLLQIKRNKQEESNV